MLSVLHLSFWDNVGGSGRAAYRLHTAFRERGVRSRMLVALKATPDPDVATIGGPWLGRLDRLTGRLVDRTGWQYGFYPSSVLLPLFPSVRTADVVQVYNTHGGYFSHRALTRLSRARPVVWRLSDMWAATGHCAYAYDCERWKTGCGACPRLDEFPPLPRDTSAQLWRAKQRIYRRSRLSLVTPSRWLANIVKESPLLAQFPVSVIPNGIDTDLFTPGDRTAARAALGIRSDGPVVMFSAASLSDPRKGGPYLREAIARLPEALRLTLTLLVVGGGEWSGQDVAATKLLGSIDDDRRLALAYAAADLYVLPTLAENLPNAALESLACGVPVVGFDVGGVGEAIRHMETGMIVPSGRADALSDAIRAMLESDTLRRAMSRRAREVAVTEYTAARQADAFLSLYRGLLEARQ